MNTALIIIDMQRALCVGEWAMSDVDRVIARINDLSARARSGGAPVFLVQHEEGEGPLQFGKEGWQLADTLVAAPGDHRVRKRTPNSFHDTDLHELLQDRGIDRLVICGLQSDFCVDTTVRQALALGYEVTLASDAHSTMDNGVITAAQIVAHHNATLANMSSFGPRVAVVPASDVKLGA